MFVYSFSSISDRNISMIFLFYRYYNIIIITHSFSVKIIKIIHIFMTNISKVYDFYATEDFSWSPLRLKCQKYVYTNTHTYMHVTNTHAQCKAMHAATCVFHTHTD